MPFKIKFLERIIQVNFQSVILVKNNTTFQHTFQPISQINMFNKCQTFSMLFHVLRRNQNKCKLLEKHPFKLERHDTLYAKVKAKQRVGEAQGSIVQNSSQALLVFHTWKGGINKDFFYHDSSIGGDRKNHLYDYGAFQFLQLSYT